MKTEKTEADRVQAMVQTMKDKGISQDVIDLAMRMRSLKGEELVAEWKRCATSLELASVLHRHCGRHIMEQMMTMDRYREALPQLAAVVGPTDDNNDQGH